ncbi:MAG: GGDEF domain-containing protein [Candidatus Eremiobacteraeota bacterium]|nr:GGDEF domain-containing protein [Candidatus Eremiobacteraeota bacterium]
MVRSGRFARRSFFALILTGIAACATLCAFALALRQAGPPADPSRLDIELAVAADAGFDALIEEELAVRAYLAHPGAAPIARYRAAVGEWQRFTHAPPSVASNAYVRKLRVAGDVLAALLAEEVALAEHGDRTRAVALLAAHEDALQNAQVAHAAIDGALRRALFGYRATIGRAIVTAKLGSFLSILLGIAAGCTLLALLREGRQQTNLALSDALTQLPNRRAFERQLGQAIATRRPEERFALLYIDLDRFKPINDRLGHAVGDEVLAQCGGRIRAALRPQDFVARIGGDEFAAIVQKVATQADADAVAARVAADVALPLEIGGAVVRVGASVGAALVPEHGDDATALLERADLAMYRVKRARRACTA